MITTQRPLKFNNLLRGGTEKYKGEIWGDKEILVSKSWISLLVLLQLYSRIFNCKPTLLVPEYYCDDTLCHLRGVANIEYYKLDEKLRIDVENIKNRISNNHFDFLVAVHYFGKEYDFNNIKTLCKSNNVLLIEDAVHASIPTGKIGKYGDFTIYSPWKIYGLYDGAILNVNTDIIFERTKDEIYREIEKIISEFDEVSPLRVNAWKLKKLVQRFIPNVKRCTIGLSDGQIPKDKTNYKEVPHKVSKFSSGILMGIKQDEMEILIERKRELSLSIEHYLFTKYGVQSLYVESFVNLMPYAIVLKIDNYDIKQKIAQEINKIGCIAFEWPKLPIDLPKDTNAFNIKNALLLITVHDGIKLERVKKQLDYSNCYRFNTHKKVEIDSIDESAYDKFSAETILPVLQSIVYAKAKEDVQGWKRNLYKISIDGKNVAVLTVLSKYGFIHRINHGPVFCNEIEDKDRIMVIEAIKKAFSGGTKGILFFAPSLSRTGFNINSMLSMGFKYRMEYFSTGFIDLNKKEEELRKGLGSKWRNCLKNAEKRGLLVHEINDKEEFYQTLNLHVADKETRSYSDSGDKITEYLYEHDSLMGLYVKNDSGDIISFVYIALHGKTATYYIGWSNDEGYKSNASRLLLWGSMIRLKSMGYHWFDLGGIDFVNTKGVAEFKSGTGCNMYEYVGEFVAY